jgi:predicted HicB family RNase H-like nuclease
MDKKLTLSLDQQTIEKAKDYAKSNKISLSKLIESYLKSLTKPVKQSGEITPLVESLSGIIDLPENYDVKENYSAFLIEKYK